MLKGRHYFHAGMTEANNNEREISFSDFFPLFVSIFSNVFAYWRCGVTAVTQIFILLQLFIFYNLSRLDSFRVLIKCSGSGKLMIISSNLPKKWL